MTRVLITGASGFIGSHLVRACLSRGDQVTAVVRPSSSTDMLPGIGSNAEVIRAQLTDVARLRSVFDRCQPELVFHAAARTRIAATDEFDDPSLSIDENLHSLLGLLKAAATSAAPPKTLIRLGTIAEYGDNSVPYVETQRERPRDSYGTSMLAGTKYLEMLRPRLPFAAVTARLSLTYGPGQGGAQLVPYLVEGLLTGQPVQIGRPDDARDFIHVCDVVRALFLLAENPQPAGPVINISTGIATKVRDVVAALIELTRASPDLAQMGAPTGPAMDLVNDPTLIKSHYPWVPEIALSEGLKDTVEWACNAITAQTLTGQNA